MQQRLTLMTAAGAALLLAAALGLRAYGLSPKVPDGFTAGGLPLSGLTLDEARARLRERSLALEAVPIRFDTNREQAAGREGTFRSLGLRWDLSAAEAALDRLEQGGAFRRAWRRFQLRGTDAAPALSLEEAAYLQYVASSWAELQAARPVPARRTITAEDRVHIIPDVPVYRVDLEALRGRLLAADWMGLWSASGTAPEEPGGDRRPEGGPSVSHDGRTAPAPRISKPLGPVHIELPLTELRAPDTYERLAAQGIDRKIMEFSTAIAPGGPGRLHNITSAAKAVHDRLLAPDEVFDYAPAIREAETRFGFREAPVIFNGKLTPGIGGGICQVSTTLYNAVLRAGLAVVERRNHSLPVSYAPLGQDATFSDGNINFRFRNSTGAYLLIRTAVESDQLTVKLFGRMPESVRYEIESVTLEELPAPVKTVVNPNLKPGRREVLQQGKPGYVVETYRTKLENGVILSKERISRDRYLPQASLIAVGGTAGGSSEPGAPEGPGVLEDGVGEPRFR
ncbi:VanW family protein [Gorillibacterium sp. sgz5001074]|uniref:VanW family protein n=1 Tax=Gorillibacterium sp. sgz5001074 TaxID=3446695 RepID=UPI003F670101